MLRYGLIAVLLVSLLGCSEAEISSGNDSSLRPQTQIKGYLSAYANNQKLNGSVLITQRDSTIIHEHFGFANREKRIAINDSTKFLIGSITKPFTAMAILLLEQDGKLSLTDKLSKYFPDFPKSDSVSIQQLLTHTSGIRDYHFFKDWKQRSKTELTPMDVIDQVKTDPYRFAPGTSFRYSNTGYIFLGLIIEKVSGQHFEDYIKERILNPLDLDQTGVITNETKPKHLALGYTTDPEKTTLSEYINYNQPFTSGNMYSTVWDLQKFTKAVMTSTLLPIEKTHEIFDPNHKYYGYGWGFRDFDGTKAYGHYGGMNGYWGSVTYIPDQETFICFLTNDDNTPKYTITRDLIKLLEEDSVDMPLPYDYRKTSQMTIDHISGSYLIKPGDTLTVNQQNDKLLLQETGQIAYELFQVGENRFVMTMQEFDVSFDKDSIYFQGMVNLIAPKLPSPNK
ncbi:MAG: hypothetical protein Salg2KO_12060 [Salibacteraceae bacterium]